MGSTRNARRVMQGLAVLGLLWSTGSCGDDSGTADGTEGAPTSSTTAPGSGTTAPTTNDPTTGETDPTTGGSSDPDSGSSSDSTGEPEVPEGTFWVFTAANGRVVTWSMNPTNGDLVFENELDVGTNVGPLAVDPQLRALYLGVLGDQRADAHAIDPVTAELSPLGSVPLGFGPVYLAVDQSGSHLLSTTFGGDELAVFPIGADGSLGGGETQRLATPQEPHSIITDASNDWLLVPHRTPDVIGQYAFDPATGMATPNAVPQVAAMPGAGPRHIVMHPDGTHAYVSDEFSDSVSTYTFDVGTGQLALVSTVSTIPNDFDGADNTCADVHITPDGRFVYVSNRGHDSLAMFTVDAATGELSSLGQVATETRPREFEISPRGRYVYAAGQDTGMMASYTVQDTGMLSPGPVYDVGDDPRWVLAIELPLSE